MESRIVLSRNVTSTMRPMKLYLTSTWSPLKFQHEIFDISRP